MQSWRGNLEYRAKRHHHVANCILLLWGWAIVSVTLPKLRTKYKNLSKIKKVRRALTGRNKPTPMDAVVLFHLWIGELQTWSHFRELFNTAIDLLFYTLFNDRFILGIFPAEKNVVPFTPQSLAVDMVSPKRFKPTNENRKEEQKDSKDMVRDEYEGYIRVSAKSY